MKGVNVLEVGICWMTLNIMNDEISIDFLHASIVAIIDTDRFDFLRL